MRTHLTFFSAIIGLSALVACKTDKKEEPNPQTPEEVVFAVETGESQLPYLIIDTKGVDIKNEPKIPAELKVYVEKAAVQSAHIGIEYRGSTSFRLSDKKSFGIDTWAEDGSDTEVSFFGFPEEEDWILLGHVVNEGQGYIFDRTLMYHQFGYRLFEEMGRYASRTEFVELQIDDDYKGVYVFMEKLKRDKNRIDIKKLEPGDVLADDITGGYILKIDKTAGGDLNINQPLEYFENNWEDDARYTENISFRSDYDIYGQPIEFDPYGQPYHANMYLETYFLYEYPKANEITAAQKNYIQAYISDFETALLTDDFSSEERTYTDFVDLSSFVDFFLLNEVVRNVDAYRLSTYLHKDRGGRLNMGPVWDLNIGYDNGGRVPIDGWVMNYNQYVESDAWMVPFWWPRLMEDPKFRAAVKIRWNSLRGGIMSTASLTAMVDATASYLIENGAVDRNYDRWGKAIGVDYDASIASLKTYLEERTQWMDGQISAF